LNSHKLGQRKNCNLPGVVSDLPVLGPKDIDDVQNFAAKHGMDYVFASFVQSADDVRMIRKVGWPLFVLEIRLHSGQEGSNTKKQGAGCIAVKFAGSRKTPTTFRTLQQSTAWTTCLQASCRVRAMCR
jgi:hypothetical protein